MADINLGVGGANSASGSYEIDNSLKLEQDNTEYLHKTPTSSGNRRTFTLSGWIKRTEVNRGSGGGDYIFHAGDGDYNQSDRTIFKFNHDDTIYWGGGSAYEIKTNRVFRDTSAWYHIAMIVDTTNSTAGDRLKLYVNGVRETDLATNTNPSQNFQYAFMKDDKQVIGYNHTDSSNPASMYIAEVVWLDGTAASITDLGEFDQDTGIWIPKDVSNLSVGTNGCYLDFEDSSNLGNDASGGTAFTLNNIAAADQATDTPTNNFAVLNIRHRVPDTTRKEGATTTVKNNNGWRTMISTLGVSSGKWYFELSAGSEYTMIGVSGDGVYGSGITYEYYVGSLTGSLGYYGNSATFFQDGVDKSPTNVSSFVADDIIGLALDVDNGKAYFHKNGTYQNSANPNTSTNGYTITGDAPYFLSMSTYQQSDQCEVNYGGYHVYSISSGNSDANGYGNFEYAVPSGYYALCTKNLSEYG